MALPLVPSTDKSVGLLQTQWKSQLDPMLSIPFLDGLQLTSIPLIIGVNAIPHQLSRMQQGWFITDQTGPASFYRAQPFNAQTLFLNANATVVISLWVY